MSILSDTAKAASLGDKQGLKDVLDFLVTEEQLGVTFVTAAIENAPGTPSEAFLPVLQQRGDEEYLHVEALKEAGGEPLTTKYWFPDAAFGAGGIGLFETLEIVETIEISLYLIGVSAFAQRGEDVRRAAVRRGDGHRGRPSRPRALRPGAARPDGRSVPNDVGFENFDWPTVASVRDALEGLGIGYGAQTSQPGRFYEYPGDPIATGVGTPVSHTTACLKPRQAVRGPSSARPSRPRNTT